MPTRASRTGRGRGAQLSCYAPRLTLAYRCGHKVHNGYGQDARDPFKVVEVKRRLPVEAASYVGVTSTDPAGQFDLAHTPTAEKSPNLFGDTFPQSGCCALRRICAHSVQPVARSGSLQHRQLKAGAPLTN